MSTKHYFPETAVNTLVPRSLRSLVAANPHLALDEAQRVVVNARNDPSTVSVIGGGGSGHEPAWSGYVGDGLLSAAACGDVFASPSTKQVLAAMRHTPSSKGHILLITNYTGDRLHFGLAAERARSSGLSPNVAVIAATDDVSIGRSKSSRVGRRGMPGHVFTMKIMSAAAAEGWSFDRCVALGRALNDQTVSIGSALDHCHVPGRQHQSIADDICVVGAGIHNEPGQQLITPFPSVEGLVERCLKLLCDKSDAERAFVQFETGDEVALLINNYGGLSVLELGALADEVQTQLGSTFHINPCRTLTGSFETSLNAPGFSISLCNISAAERQCKEPTSKLLQLLDHPTTAVSWPNIIPPNTKTPKPHMNGISKEEKTDTDKNTLVVDPSILKAAVQSACQAALAAEPQLTKWDLVMGDGDCGEAVQRLCESILRLLEDGGASKGSVLQLLDVLTEAVDDMGGTLGAILGILLSAFSSSLRTTWAAEGSFNAQSPLLYATSLASAVESLKTHTTAREGDRTVMDVLIPFADVFANSGELASAVAVSGEKAEATRFLAARLGRASYVGDESAHQLPDPGAWAMYELLWGFSRGLGIRVTRIDGSN